MKRTIPAVLVSVFIAAGVTLGQAVPPAFVNYQGVLRDNNDRPLTGSYDIVFHFMSASAGGTEILIDSHTSTGGNAVQVTGGLFNTTLGGGTITDGSGAGTYTSLSAVFRDYATVYLKIVVNGEELTGRPRLVSAAYALNSDLVDGKNASDFSAAVHSHPGTDITSAVANSDMLDSQHASSFVNLGSTTQTKLGTFRADASSISGADGIVGIGAPGGFFQDSGNTSQSYVASAGYGIDANGTEAGGYFEDADGSGLAYVGYGNNGITAFGSLQGGYFADSDNSGRARAGFEDYGVYAWGNTSGGYFADADNFGSAYVGYGNTGIEARGSGSGAYFEDTDSTGYAYVAQADDGIAAYGNGSGGYFENLTDQANANVAWFGRGIWARGPFAGGTFSTLDGNWWADVAHKDGYKIKGVGVVSFVQNHPYDATRSIVYAAPEGDEVAVYTRGTARLVKGEARVRLGDTFRWVANPDIGLTAHLTPHGPSRGLYVAALTTEELVVRENDGGTSDVGFDFLVYGLRLGFEQLAILQVKERDALPPTADAIAKPYEGHDELRASNALARYKAMRLAAGETGEPDLSRAHALLAALEAQRAEALARGIANAPPLGGAPPEPPPSVAPEAPPRGGDPDATSNSAEGSVPGGSRLADLRLRRPLVRPSLETPDEDGGRASDLAADATSFPVSEAVEPGDLLALDPERPGELRRASDPADPSVVGVASAAPPVSDAVARVLVAGAGFVSVKADASFGAIAPGDFLTSSPTPGHAMKAPVPALAGTVVGKALERLDGGTGTIRVLLMAR